MLSFAGLKVIVLKFCHLSLEVYPSLHTQLRAKHRKIHNLLCGPARSHWNCTLLAVYVLGGDLLVDDAIVAILM
jgi:hypothetical protein